MKRPQGNTCSRCGKLGHNARTCHEGAAILSAPGGCKWTREDGRTLTMPWTIDQLWARLCRDAALETPVTGEDR